ncbi:alpha/beta fold hydrolase [Pigmentiphaga aceris]|uniref:Alpha/beta fold hydrolase n=1 Tax=Pigmentiphaga aceris TaxID=1940612 RepID=A0A5C0AXF2_9BURK|nr:alpha/beta fold hydrolase [Pigmentiphaga aceris]QEI05321.1 alpha/beta fold hydrolase [Pigmentiphaga aceris]
MTEFLAPAVTHDIDNIISTLNQRFSHHRIPVHQGVVHWRTLGNGPPLIMLHGGHGDWGHWVRNLDALAARHQLWIPDMPGYGDSTADAGSLDDIVIALRASMNVLFGPDADIDLIGFSFGGLVATTLAAQRQHIRRMALIGTAGHGGARRERGRMLSWRHPDDPATEEAALRNNMQSLMVHHAASIDDLSLALYRQAVLSARFRSKPLSTSGRLLPVLAQCRHPVLLIWGEFDVTAVPEDVAPALCAAGPDRHWEVVAGAGHWAQYERAEAVNALLSDWFGK